MTVKLLDQLAENIKKLPDDRKEVLEQLLRENRLYTIQEASNLLGVAVSTLRRQIRLKRIKTAYIGRLLRIPSEEIVRIMQGEKLFLNSEEVAKLLGVTKATICKMIGRGEIQATRITESGPFKISKSEVIRITKEGTE